MLANQYGLFQIWQLPVILLVIAGWVIGGGYLFQKTFSKLPNYKRMKLGKAIQISLLSGGVGWLTAGMVFGVFYKALEMPKTGVIVAIPFFLIMAYLVVFSMFKESVGETLRASLLPLVSILLLAGIAGAACGIPSIMIRRAYVKEIKLQRITTQNLDYIYQFLRNRPSKLPKSMEEILELEGVDPEWLKSPANPSRKIGFFYFQPERLGRADAKSQKLLACDFADNFADYPEQGRAVLYTHGEPVFLPAASFESLLTKPENKEFAEALKKAEGR